MELAEPARGGSGDDGGVHLMNDVDAHHARAEAAGAEIVQPPHNESYGRTCPWRIHNYAAIGIWNRPRQWCRQA